VPCTNHYRQRKEGKAKDYKGFILQYVAGVPLGLVLLYWGLGSAWKAFTKTADEEKNNGFGAGIAFLCYAAIGWGILWAILFEGLHFGGGPGRYG